MLNPEQTRITCECVGMLTKPKRDFGGKEHNVVLPRNLPMHFRDTSIILHTGCEMQYGVLCVFLFLHLYIGVFFLSVSAIVDSARQRKSRSLIYLGAHKTYKESSGKHQVMAIHRSQ